MKLSKLLLSAIALSISTLSFAQTPPEATLAAPPAPKADQIVLKFSSVTSGATPKGLAAEFFAKRAGELTKGKVKVEVYHSSKLFKDKEEFDALLQNKVHFLAPSVGKFGPFGVPEYEVFGLPYLFENTEKLYKVTDGKIGKDLFNKLEVKGMLGLAYWDNGFKSFSANSPLRKPSDFQGKIFRVQDTKVLEDQMKSLSARPVAMAFAEMFPALQTGVADGAENPHSNFLSEKLPDAQRYLTVSDHGYLGYAVVVNADYWKALPTDIREPLESAMKEATIYERKISSESNDKALKEIIATGKVKVYNLTQAEKDVLKTSWNPVYENIEKQLGMSFMESLYKEVGR